MEKPRAKIYLRVITHVSAMLFMNVFDFSIPHDGYDDQWQTFVFQKEVERLI